MTGRSRFPRAKPSKGPSLPRLPRNWRSKTHVFIRSGSYTHDDKAICGECGFVSDHAIHDLTNPHSEDASAVDSRKLGEGVG